MRRTAGAPRRVQVRPKASTGARSPAKDGANAAEAASNGQQGLQSDAAAGEASARLHLERSRQQRRDLA